MKQYKTKNLKTKQKEHQKSFQFIEYPQMQEYYSNQMNSNNTKPKRIIVTEVYDEKIPNVKNNQQRSEYFNYYTESSQPYSNQQIYKTIGENRVFSQNKNKYFTRNQDMNMNGNFNQFFSDYNKKLYFGRTDLREEYPNPSNERVNIRKKVHRGSNTPQPMRNNYDLRNDLRNEDFIENFQYYESKNIKDKSNKKYQSITRVTGYSNLVPINNRRIETSKFNSVNLARYNNFKELRHNYSNVDVYNNANLYSLRQQMIEKKKPQTPEKITKVQIQKTVKNYEIQKKPQITQIQTTTKRKYESSKMPQTTTTTKTTNIIKTQTQSAKRKYESTKIPQNTTKATQIQTISKRKYESTKKPETITKTTNIKVQNTASKYSLQKKKELASKSAYQEKKTAKKYNIDLSKYNRDTDRLVFTKSSGRYRYKDNITEKDVINSRKGNSEAKNIKKVEVVEKNEKEEKKARLENISKSTITNVKKTEASSKITEKAAKNILSSKTKTNISNLNKAYDDRRINKTSTEIKTAITTTKNKALNKANFNKNIQNINTNNKRKANIANINITKKVNIVDTYNEGLNLNKYKNEYINQEIRRNDMSRKYLNTSLSDKRIYDNSNFNNNAFIENREIKEIYEIKQKQKEASPKTKLIKKNVGDNYKYYESKFVQSPNENTNINSYTLHQRRNQRVIYSTEEIEIDNEEKKMKSYKLKQEGGKHKHKHKAKSKKIVKKKMINMPINRDEGNYVVYGNYYQGNYNYDMGREMDFDQYENGEENNYEDEEVIYYQ